MRLNVDKKADERNVKAYNDNYARLDDLCGKPVFECVLCGRKVSLDISSSLRGRLLVCGWCTYSREKFENGWKSVREWQEDTLHMNSPVDVVGNKDVKTFSEEDE